MSNVDHAELDKFSQIAHRWWDANSEFKTLHDINPLRLEWIIRLAGGLQGKHVADVGCGGGILSESMALQGAQVTGIDLAEKALQVARLHQLESGVEVDYRLIAAEDLAAEQPASYDVVTCMELLEHVPDPVSVMAACARMAKPDGWVFFSTLNRNPKSYLFAILGAEYVLNMLPRGTHDWAKFIKPHELSGYARRAGLESVELTGLTYNLFTKAYRLDRDTDVNYLMACRRA